MNKSEQGSKKMTTRKVITDNAKATGYIDGYQQSGKREPSDSNQASSYEEGYRKGCRDRAKDS